MMVGIILTGRVGGLLFGGLDRALSEHLLNFIKGLETGLIKEIK